MEEYVTAYKQLIYTQIENLDESTKEGKDKFNDFMIELEASNYIILVSEDLEKLNSNKIIYKDKGKNVKLRYQLNIIKNFIRHLPNKSEHEVVFKKNCQRVIQWLFFTIKE